ncbi:MULTISPECIES: CHAD domain-containing protein [Ralstonia]|jgi:CHAD domain-containing protein|uniref:CHAD domain-containing protein n=5 Tax=Pseudomonadota TaxID=1224 RepID=A0ABN9IDW0_9RALS|nr:MULTISPECIES: CHAD domain-containing protein [Ralstonia]MBE3066660.1 CHAD domain-containing protein [Chloroflexota bacterium]MEA3268252.1 CHAD domain-containing protein [Pseudomonadota bacterium]ENZ77331.1 hypothetical protein OR214_02955 [Ralstonia pickettii OR214]MBB0022599.1 CHAD domain-containing protein [Ralstonia pickettii]MBB0032700.1 CHAD domain-containing protein [Ralstonia pickettii]
MVNSAASSPLHAEAQALSMLSRLATPEIAIVEHWAPEYLRSNDPEIGHRMRVAIRRLRALLWAYRDLLPKALADDWRCRLADVAAQIGPPRNWDIIVNVLLRAAVPPSQPSALILLEALEDIRQRARAESRVTFEGIGPEKLMADFREAIGNATQAQPETSETLGKFAPASIAAASRRVNRALRRASNGGLQELHQTRIQIKRLRYLLEFFSPVLGKKDIKRIRRLEQLQDALGELNDVVVGATYISQVPVRPEYATAHELFVQWLRKEKKARRRAAIAALGCLPCER